MVGVVCSGLWVFSTFLTLTPVGGFTAISSAAAEDQNRRFLHFRGILKRHNSYQSHLATPSLGTAPSRTDRKLPEALKQRRDLRGEYPFAGTFAASFDPRPEAYSPLAPGHGDSARLTGLGPALPFQLSSAMQTSTISPEPHYALGLLGGRIQGEAGAGPAVIAFIGFLQSHKLSLQIAPGIVHMGGSKTLKSERILGPSSTNSGESLVQQIVIQKPPVLVVPLFHVSFSPIDLPHRVRPFGGLGGGIAQIRDDAFVLARLLAKDPSGRAVLIQELRIGTIPAKRVKFAAALTAGIALGLEATNRHNLQGLVGFFPGGSIVVAGYYVNF